MSSRLQRVQALAIGESECVRRPDLRSFLHVCAELCVVGSRCHAPLHPLQFNDSAESCPLVVSCLLYVSVRDFVLH